MLPVGGCAAALMDGSAGHVAGLHATPRARRAAAAWHRAQASSPGGSPLLPASERCAACPLRCHPSRPQDGDGCSSACTVEPGFTCTATSPSICAPAGTAQPQGGPDAPPLPDPHVGPSAGGGDAPPPPPRGGQRGKRTRRHGWVVVVVVLAAAGAVVGAAWVGREQLLDSFPRLEAAVASLAARLPGQRHRYDFAGALAVWSCSWRCAADVRLHA